jgi:hypothetical protein
MLRRYATTEVISIEDVTPFVVEQRSRLGDLAALQVPFERVYVPSALAANRVGRCVGGMT